MDRSVPSVIFTVDDDRVRSILHDYGIQDSMDTITELLRYNFSEREVRLILKVTFKNRAPVVIKLKNEKDLSREVVEQQSAFSAMLERHGVPVAGPLQTHGKYTSLLSAGGRDVIVKVEEFREKELPYVDLETAKKTGKLLANTHNTSEAHHCHVHFPVTMHPMRFRKNCGLLSIKINGG